MSLFGSQGSECPDEKRASLKRGSTALREKTVFSHTVGRRVCVCVCTLERQLLLDLRSSLAPNGSV